MVHVSRKHNVVEEASEAEPASRVISRRPVTWAEAMMRIRQAIAALPRESELEPHPEETGWEQVPESESNVTSDNRTKSSSVAEHAVPTDSK